MYEAYRFIYNFMIVPNKKLFKFNHTFKLHHLVICCYNKLMFKGNWLAVPSVIFSGLPTNLDVKLISQCRFAVAVITYFQSYTVQAHANLGLAIAHVDLHQLEHLHSILLEGLVWQYQHGFSDRILWTKSFIADWHNLILQIKHIS